MVYVKEKKKERKHLEQLREAGARDDPGGVDQDPTLQGLGCCDKDLDFNSM